MSPAAPVIRIACITLSCGNCCGLVYPVVGCELLVALTAVEQMALHRCARLRDGTGLNRLQDLLMFLLKGVKLDTAGGGRRAGPDRTPRGEESAQVFQKPPEQRGHRARRARHNKDTISLGRRPTPA